MEDATLPTNLEYYFRLPLAGSIVAWACVCMQTSMGSELGEMSIDEQPVGLAGISHLLLAAAHLGYVCWDNFVGSAAH